MIKLTVKKFNDFTKVCPVIARIEVEETNQEIPSINIFKHDRESNNYLGLDLSGEDGQYEYCSYCVEEGFLSPEKAEVFIENVLAEIKTEIAKHRGYKWEQEEEYTVEI